MGRLADAIMYARTAQSLEHQPSAVVISHVGKILYMCGTLDHAFDVLQLALQINPNFFFTHWHLGMVLFDRGDTDVAIEHLRQAHTLAPEFSGVIASLGNSYALLGLHNQARSWLDSLKVLRCSQYVPAIDLATIYAGLGDTNAAFAALEEAFTEKCMYLTWLHFLPQFKTLSRDPRFPVMLARLGVAANTIQAVRTPAQR